MTQLKVEIVCASPNVPIVSPNGQHWGSEIGELVPLMDEVGYAGLQVHPHRALIRSIIAAAADGDQRLISRVHSAHEANNSGKGLTGAIMNLWMPTSVQSIPSIAAMQRALPHPVSGVFFPDKLESLGGVLTDENTATPTRMVQPAPEPYHWFGVRHSLDFQNKMSEIGLPWIALDWAHQVRKGADGRKAPGHGDATYHLRSGRVQQLHIPGDRSDLRKRDPNLAARTKADADVFIHGTVAQARKTMLGKRVQISLEHWVPPEGGVTLPLVVETKTHPVGRRSDFIEWHGPFVEKLTKVVEAAGAVVVGPHFA